MNAQSPCPALTKELESVLTIDGQGRPAKARLLLKLLEEKDQVKLLECLKEIAARKFF